MAWRRVRCILRQRCADRLPRTGELFVDGKISARLAATIVRHTDLIEDVETLRLVDKMHAEEARGFGTLSVIKTAQAIDAVVDRCDQPRLSDSFGAAT